MTTTPRAFAATFLVVGALRFAVVIWQSDVGLLGALGDAAVFAVVAAAVVWLLTRAPRRQPAVAAVTPAAEPAPVQPPKPTAAQRYYFRDDSRIAERLASEEGGETKEQIDVRSRARSWQSSVRLGLAAVGAGGDTGRSASVTRTMTPAVRFETLLKTVTGRDDHAAVDVYADPADRPPALEMYCTLTVDRGLIARPRAPRKGGIRKSETIGGFDLILVYAEDGTYLDKDLPDDVVVFGLVEESQNLRNGQVRLRLRVLAAYS